MIDRDLKRCLGQMISGVQVVAARHDGVTRAYCSHWITQVSFDEPIIMASVSPRHDTYPLMRASERFCVSVLAADQIEEGQYFSYPGRKFKHVAPEFLTETNGWPHVPGALSWLGAEVVQVTTAWDRGDAIDHHLFFARVTEVGEGRLGEDPLLYSSRLGWRKTGGKARTRDNSVRDRLLARVEAAEGTAPE
ncbi:MAG: flavin reductase family protein [Microthrixaceae bacterium]